MSVGKLLVIGFLAFGAVVYVAVLAMCRAAARADRDDERVVAPPRDVLVDLDGTVLHGYTPPLGVTGIRGIPTPRHGVPVPGPWSQDRLGPGSSGTGSWTGG